MLSVHSEAGLGWLLAAPAFFVAGGLLFVILGGIWLVIAGTTFRAGRWALFVGQFLELSAMITLAGHRWPRLVSKEGK